MPTIPMIDCLLWNWNVNCQVWNNKEWSMIWNAHKVRKVDVRFQPFFYVTVQHLFMILTKSLKVQMCWFEFVHPWRVHETWTFNNICYKDKNCCNLKLIVVRVVKPNFEPFKLLSNETFKCAFFSLSSFRQIVYLYTKW